MTSEKQNTTHDSTALLNRLEAIKTNQRAAPLLHHEQNEGCECSVCLDAQRPGGGRSARFVELFRHKTSGPSSVCWCDKCLAAALARSGRSPWATPGAKRRLRREGEKYLRGLQPEPWPSFALGPEDENDLRWFFSLGPKPKWISPKVQRRWARINRCLAGGGGRLRLFLENGREHSDPLFSAFLGEADVADQWTVRIDGFGTFAREIIPKGFLGAVDRLLVHRDDKPPNSIYNPYAAERHERERFLVRHVAERARTLLESEYAGYLERSTALRKNARAWKEWPPFAVIDAEAFTTLCLMSGEPLEGQPSTWLDVLLTDVNKARRLLVPQNANPLLRTSPEEMQRIANLSDAAVMDVLSRSRASRAHDGDSTDCEDDARGEESADAYETVKERRRRERQEERALLSEAVKSGAARAWGADGHSLAPAGFKADVTGEQAGHMLTTASEIAREYGLPAETARAQLEKLACPGAALKGRRAIPVVWLQSDAGREFRSVMTRIMMAESNYQRALRRAGR